MSMEHLNKSAKLDESELSEVAGGAANYGGIINSGTFRSSTDTKLNIIVEWAVTGVSGNKRLQVNVSTSSYSLVNHSVANAIELRVNNTPYFTASNSINYSSNSVLANLALGSFNVPVADGANQLTVYWHFNGTYSGQPLGDIIAQGMAHA